jgi:hypothetical protein
VLYPIPATHHEAVVANVNGTALVIAAVKSIALVIAAVKSIALVIAAVKSMENSNTIAIMKVLPSAECWMGNWMSEGKGRGQGDVLCKLRGNHVHSRT